MSKSSKRVKVNKVSQGKLPAAESLQSKPAPAQVQANPTIQASASPALAQKPVETPQVKPSPAAVPTAKSQTSTPPAGTMPSRTPAPNQRPSETTGGLSTSRSKVSLEFFKPGARQVAVAGSFNGWKPEDSLKPAGNGRWVADLNVGPGRYEYLFIVDGQWQPDPNAKESVSNPFGGQNSVLIVSE